MKNENSVFPQNQTVSNYSYKGFQSVNPSNIKEISKIRFLNLEGNNIVELPIKLNKLEGLSLSNNNISSLSLSMVQRFQNYPKLKILNLSNNQISSFNDDLSKLKNLAKLILSGNQLNSIKISNSKLLSLDLSCNSFRFYPEMLPPSLLSLNLGSNHIFSLSMVVSNIVELRLQMNGLSSISDDVQFPKLKVLDISKNNIKSLPNLAIITPILEYFNGSSNLMSTMPTFPKTIIEINMADNQISYVENLNTMYPKIEWLNLNQNRLQVMPQLPSSLISLFLSDNQLHSFIPSNLPKLDLLHLNNNQISEFPNYKLKSLTILDLSNNLFTQIPQNLPKTLNVLNMSNNFVNQICDEVFKLPKLYFLFLNNNKIESIPESIKQSHLLQINVSMNLLTKLPPLPTSIKRIFATNNSITSIPRSYADLTELREICVSNNQISDIPSLPYVKKFRASCNKLNKFPVGLSDNSHIIDLSFNHISDIPEFTRFQKLFDLDLSHNQISTISRTIENCSELRYLNLGYNKLKTPMNLEKLTKLSLLNIAGNQISNVECHTSIRAYITTTDDASPIKTKIADNDMNAVSFAEMPGRRKEMEDSVIIAHNQNDISVFAVYDGHCGDFISRFGSFQLYEASMTCNDISSEFIENVLQISNEYLRKKNVRSGSTLAFSFLKDDKLMMGNLGDARILIIDDQGDIKFHTKDHKPYDRSEFERIQNVGGYIASNNRINGFLAVSRALGDYKYKGVSCIPDTTSLTLANNDKWLIIGCDGIFDKLSNEEIAKLAVHENSADRLSYILRNTAYGAGSQDNLSVIAINLHKFIHHER